MFFTNKNYFYVAGISALAIFAMTSCGKDDDTPDPEGYTIPSTYNFENVDYSGQVTRLDMLDELKSEMSKGTSQQVSAQKLKDMFTHENNPFTNPDLNAATSKELENKTYPLDTLTFEAYMDSLAEASVSFAQTAAPGQAGVVTSDDLSKKYLVSANGFEYAQIIQKGLMGATFKYQALESYLSEDKIGNGVDNSTVTPGKGTTMEHHWDEAFGYLGVPADYPTNTTGARYWGSYATSIGSKIGANTKLMNAFITGRAAISNKDMATKDQQIVIIKEEWERLSAAAAIHYFNSAKSSWQDEAIRAHVLSEAVGFVMALKYNSDKKISQTQIDQVLDLLNFPDGSLWDVAEADVDSAKTILNSVYNFDDPDGL